MKRCRQRKQKLKYLQFRLTSYQLKSAFCAIRLQNNNNNNIATADYYPAAQIKDLLLRFIIPGKISPAEGRRQRRQRHARATPTPRSGDVYEEGPLIQTRVFRSVSLTLTDGGQA